MRSKNNENEIKLSSGAQGRFFEIRVKGQLDESWSDWLEGLEVKLLDNDEMLLSGQIKDQAALMGILNKLYHLNLVLLSLCQINQKIHCRNSTKDTGRSQNNYNGLPEK